MTDWQLKIYLPIEQIDSHFHTNHLRHRFQSTEEAILLVWCRCVIAVDWTGWNDELMKPTNIVIHGTCPINWAIPRCPLNFDFKRTEASPHGLTCCWSRFPTAAWKIINLKYGAVGVDFRFVFAMFSRVSLESSYQREVQLLKQIADLNRQINTSCLFWSRKPIWRRSMVLQKQNERSRINFSLS